MNGNKGQRERRKRLAKPLDGDALYALAIRYVGRYATSRAKLTAYLRRKIRERGWEDEQAPGIDALVGAMAERGYVDDAQYALSRARSLHARGYGAYRLEQTLYAAGIAEPDRDEATQEAEAAALDSATIFARKRRIGPFALAPAPHELREKQLRAFVRAGHGFDIARRFVMAEPGDDPDTLGPDA